MSFEAVERNLRACFRAIASDRPGAEARDFAGITIASAGAEFQMFNSAFLAEPAGPSEADLERRFAAAKVHFNARGIDWAFWLCEGLVDRSLHRRFRSTAARHGLTWAVDLPGMYADGLLCPRRPLPKIEVRRVADEATRLAFCDIGSVCFHVPMRWFREIFLWQPMWTGPFAGYVGYVDGEPVVTAATMVDSGAGSGVVGVYNVATLPSHRRRGYGEALVRHALDAVAKETGIRRTILQSTKTGLALYQQMGYRAVTKVSVYAS